MSEKPPEPKEYDPFEDPFTERDDEDEEIRREGLLNPLGGWDDSWVTDSDTLPKEE